MRKVSLSQPKVSGSVIRIQLEYSLTRFNGFIFPLLHVIDESQRHVDSRSEWIEYQDAFGFNLGFFKARGRHQKEPGIPGMSGRIVRIEFDRPLKMSFCSRPIVFVYSANKPE